MGSYRIQLLKSADRDIRKIDKQQIKRILSAIRALSDEPFPTQHRKLRGSESSFRLRVGDYRVIYEVDKGKEIIEIFYVRHRKDAYRK